MRKTTLTRNVRRALAICAFGVGLALLSRGPERAGAQTDLFKERVAPILEANCVMCHGARVQRSGLDLRTFEAALKGGSRGPAIIPGNPEKSVLYRMVTHREEPAMPLGGDKLKSADIAAIKQWIETMKPVALSVVAASTTPVRQPGYAVTEKDRQFWSFVKPVRPAVAQIKSNWIRNEIDASVLKRLQQQGLKPSAPAAPRDLLRRVYYDLIGLPPTPEEMDAFLKDPSDRAYKKVIDELLASPHYGERWGRHWLDLARYADSGGYEFDIDRPHAWRYRDYVIKSFNEDKPYDQFIREQLANDQLKPGEAEALIATGFCRNGPTVDNANNEETRMDELDDMVTTTSSVFLGMTVGCARCHDHKYDPIPQRDYYRMQAVFFPFQKTEKPLVAQSELDAHASRNKEIDAQVKPLKQKMAGIEKPVRQKLLAEKVDFHVKLAQSVNGLGGKTVEEFRAETAQRFAKDVNIQPEEIDALLSPEVLQTRKALQKEIDAVNAARPKPLPSVMGVTDKDDPGKAFLLNRGDWRNKGEEVGPGLPQVVASAASLDPKACRKQLAEWIASRENPLTARIAVNRIWQYHFGNGIVKTPSDFGATGDRPSHPELLDWLAVEFMDGSSQFAVRSSQSLATKAANRELRTANWTWKRMHRLILTSNTYRQSSQFNEQAAAKDPENRLLWRMTPHRLEAEAIRDSVLVLSGKLNREMYGPGIYPRIDPDIVNTGSRPRWPLDAKDEQSTWRRSVYIYVKRSVLVPLIEVFDCPVTTVSAPSRAVSTVSPQALALLNNEFVLEQAGFFAGRVAREAGADKRAQVSRAFKIALGRSPSEKEIESSLSFLKSQTDGYQQRKLDRPETSALRDFCHAIINLNEFLYVD